MSKLPLEGLRVIDATTSWAGAYTTNVMGTFGAEVIKIEAIQRLDIWRAAGVHLVNPPPPSNQAFEWSPPWNAVNTNKIEITLNLSKPKGVEVFKGLAAKSDVVVENFTPRVMANFGLDYPVLKTLNPKLVMVSMAAYGQTGPWKYVPGFAHPIEMMAGFAQLMGEPDGPPKICGAGFTDPIAGTNAMIAVMFALLYRQMTGEGQYIDLSQVEASTCLIGEALLDYSVNNRIQTRQANQHPFMAPHGYYKCKGDEKYIGIAVATDEEWASFCKAIGEPAWTKNKKFSDSLSRWNNRKELDELVEKWTINHDHYAVTQLLQKAGIAAGPFLTSVELLQDPHLKERDVFQYVDRALVGKRPYPVPTIPMRLSEAKPSIYRPAPLLGEHNEYILSKILGMSDEEIKTLEREQIIGKVPLGL